MVTVCILIGLGLLIGGIVIVCATRNERASRVQNAPPHLPSRNDIRTPLLTAARTRTTGSRSSSTPPLPPRRNTGANTVFVSSSYISAVSGPRGVRPAQFPCCPYDKQRNIPGERQLIFWDNSANCYYCSRGHKFKSNGKLFLVN